MKMKEQSLVMLKVNLKTSKLTVLSNASGSVYLTADKGSLAKQGF